LLYPNPRLSLLFDITHMHNIFEIVKRGSSS
jgi:hypothetical protein